MCYSPWGRNELDRTEQLRNSNTTWEVCVDITGSREEDASCQKIEKLHQISAIQKK